MKQFRKCGWAHSATAAAVMLVSAAAYGQQAAPDQYSGVAKPPSDDTIVANADMQPAAQPAAAKPSPSTPAAAPAVAPPPATCAPPATSNNTYNPDNDIVSSVPAQGGPITPTAQLQTRNPDAGIVTYVPSPANQLPEGTNIRVRMTQGISTRETTAGTEFKAEVTTAVFKDGRIIVPPGSMLKGRVVSVRQGHHFTGAATLHLRPDMILLPDGTAYHLYARVIQSQAPGTRTDSEGGIEPSSHWKKNAVEYGAGAGVGAVVGAQLAGPHGAIIGAGIGAGVVTAHLLTQHPDAAVVPEGSIVTFSLSEPMELTPTRN